ncbi:hypothetical protein VE04_02366 [Pseudogymnoascus sp. 24MN13]|nr:hypothetical protein VE04_02366 [Pseudogymnoascus sp. 24MN13]
MASRPVRVANCSGYKNDPYWQMLRQATLGDVDFITGDYLAEMNLAEDAEAYRAGKHDGWEETAWEGIKESINVIAAKKIKVVLNGGCLNPAGLAQKVADLVSERDLKVKVAYVSGDDLMSKLGPDLASLGDKLPRHLDSVNPNVQVPNSSLAFQALPSVPIVSANAYLGARAIVEGLRAGADIIICGRVSDASPVIAAAWYWHSWKDTDYNQLAGSLIAGHLIECSAYSTGGNFSGFTEYDLETFIEPGFPIAEIDADGTCIIGKHLGTGGMITEDTIRCQFLYELQGNIYLHSDVKAYLNNVVVTLVGKDRGITGRPPPPTTKAAIFYRGGYQSQLLLNATGYGTEKKWQLLEAQLRRNLQNAGIEKDLSLLEFQIVGVPEANPKSQLRSTTYCRVFVEAAEPEPLVRLLRCFSDIALRHFSGFHCALDYRTALPNPFLAYYPSLYSQDDLEEGVTLIGSKYDGNETKTISSGHPPSYEDLERRENYDAVNAASLSSFGPTIPVRLGDIVLARSGDKGSNLNCGLFVKDSKLWEWFRAFLSRAHFKELLGGDWADEYWLERVEFPGIHAVHFVIYGILGRGVSGSTRLDSLGKGFADYFRDKVVEVPVALLGAVKGNL